MRFESLVIVLLCALGVHAAVYTGKVVDEKGQPISYATVYPEVAPELGTATNNDGIFRFEANLPASSPVVVSFIGFEKVEVTGDRLRVKGDASLQVIVLKEQPIALQETVVAAKSSKQRNKRKQMATLLHAVYVQLEKEFPDEPAQYQVVSDVRMTSGEAQTGHAAVWGMEQMIANIVVLPEAAKGGRDSVQFQGRFCKRFFDARKRAQADSILAGQTLERLEKAQKDVTKGTPQNYMRRAANAVDSGVVVHEALFAIGNMRYDFQETMNDIKHWSVSNESEGETVLTHTQKVSKYLGCFKMTFQRHYIIDSRTYSVRRFSEHAEVKVVIPFGIKLNSDQLQMLNLVNMDEEQINKFRLKRLRGAVDLNTIYQRRNGLVYTQEKNMILNAFIVGSKKTEIPIHIQATQRVTDLQTEGVKALKKHQLTRRVRREIVEIY
ncbi:MAG: carboxypeptidase-like regulatory domain-containing protein [Paludibacteraceae bacterium]|nr:carboxypeptidase-like regulatory domain-containing protein [Paludibacteraceae bacterium]